MIFGRKWMNANVSCCEFSLLCWEIFTAGFSGDCFLKKLALSTKTWLQQSNIIFFPNISGASCLECDIVAMQYITDWCFLWNSLKLYLIIDLSVEFRWSLPSASPLQNSYTVEHEPSLQVFGIGIPLLYWFNSLIFFFLFCFYSSFVLMLWSVKLLSKRMQLQLH